LSHTHNAVDVLPIEGSAIFAFLVEARRGDTHMQTNPFATEAAGSMSLVKSEQVSLEATCQRKGKRARDIREVR
jgi:hypothetical protein